MSPAPPPHDLVIFGGGIAGLWLLDAARQAGHAAILLERTALGAGQTVWSQGILHGGAKYTLRGLSNELANVTRVIADMPSIWRACLSGARQPDLSAATIRAEHCHLWRTSGIGSWVGMQGAAQVLKTPVQKLPKREWPAALAGVPGDVLTIAEQSVSPRSIVEAFAARNAGHLFQMPAGVDLASAGFGQSRWTLTFSDGTAVCTRAVAICAGSGNGPLRRVFGLADERQQIRPLLMVMARGADLPELHGHCIDGARTRITITSDRDAAGRMVWQLGGELAERGHSLTHAELLQNAAEELRATVPGTDLAGVEFATYDAPRAEERTERGFRPDDVSVIADGTLFTVWPTKLVLAPRVAEVLLPQLAPPSGGGAPPPAWPAPPVSLPPWETATDWEVAT